MSIGHFSQHFMKGPKCPTDTSAQVPNCLRSEVSWVRSVRTPKLSFREARWKINHKQCKFAAIFVLLSNTCITHNAYFVTYTSLCLQAKWYSNSLNCIMLVETTPLTQLVSLSLLYFGCRRKNVHLCFIMSPGKMIFAVLELLMSPYSEF